MTHKDVCVDEGAHRRAVAREARVLRMTSSQDALRFPAGTLNVPARARKSVVRARTARLPSTRNTTSSPSLIPRASRTTFGTVICPFDVTFAATSTRLSLLLAICKDSFNVELVRPNL